MRTSEYVSIGHPDKVADYISEYILDQLLKQDPKTRYALEVQIKDYNVTLGGEVTTNAEAQYEQWAREAINKIGYTFEYAKKWGFENTICGDRVDVNEYISQQSNDIAQGVDRDGWGDQGIFVGYAENNESTNYMPLDHFLARDLCQMLYKQAKIKNIGGLDIKTQITVDDDGFVMDIVVAVPCKSKKEYEKIFDSIMNWAKPKDINPQTRMTINGTGSYIKHSSMGDCGTTGRKLAVDFYGGNSPIGGGSPWTKDGTKADLALNLAARAISLISLEDCEHPFKHHAITKISCCIGQSMVFIQTSIHDIYGNVLEIKNNQEQIKPSEIIKNYDLQKPIFSILCSKGLFGQKDEIYKWE